MLILSNCLGVKVPIDSRNQRFAPGSTQSYHSQWSGEHMSAPTMYPSNAAIEVDHMVEDVDDDIELGTAGNDFHFKFLHMHKHFETWL